MSILKLVPPVVEKPKKSFKTSIKEEYWQQLLDMDTFGNSTEFLIEFLRLPPRNLNVNAKDVKKLIAHLRQLQFEDLQAEVKGGFNFTITEFKKLFRELRKERSKLLCNENKKDYLAFVDREIKMYGIEFAIYNGDETATIKTGENKQKFINEMKSLLNLKK